MALQIYGIAFRYLFVIATYSIIFFADDFIRFLGKEDGPIENMGALFFAVSAALFFAAYVRSAGSGSMLRHFKTDRNIWYLLLAILFLVCLGEEISWGQRLFNLETPRLLKDLNAQGEISFHNLWLFQTKNPDGSHKSYLAMMLNMSRLFSIFWLFFCVLTPLVNRISGKANVFLNRLAVPVSPLWIGALFLVNYFVFHIVSRCLSESPGAVISSLNELKESNYAVIFFFFGFHELRKLLSMRSPSGQE